MYDEHLVMLQGRILAQELLMRMLVAGSLMNNSDDPLAALDHVRNELRASIQNAERPVGEEEDAIVEAAMTALFSELDNVERRIRGNPRG